MMLRWLRVASRADSNNSVCMSCHVGCFVAEEYQQIETEKTGHFLSQIIPGMLAIIIAHFRDAFSDTSSAYFRTELESETWHN